MQKTLWFTSLARFPSRSPVATLVFPRGHNWVQPRSTSPSMMWMKEQSVSFTGLLMIPNWEDWLRHHQAVLPFSCDRMPGMWHNAVQVYLVPLLDNNRTCLLQLRLSGWWYAAISSGPHMSHNHRMVRMDLKDHLVLTPPPHGQGHLLLE